MQVLPLTPATGTNNPNKQVSVDVWNAGHEAVGVVDRTALAALGTSPRKIAYLGEAGREGLFVWSSSNLSSMVAADAAQGIYVAPSSDPTGASGAWVRQFEGVVNIKWFGAACDADKLGATGTDDTAAVQAAIDYLWDAHQGGTILIPGYCICASSLDLVNKSSINLVGVTNAIGGYNLPPPSQLIYTGTGSVFIDAAHSYSVEIRNLGVRYSSASFAGDLIAFTNKTGGGDPHYPHVENCLIGGIYNQGSAVNGARSLVSLEGAILAKIRGNHFSYGQVGIRGRVELSPGNYLYSNAHVIDGNNVFDNCTVAAILNAGETWTIIGNTFEGTNGLGPDTGMPYAYLDNLSSGAASGGFTFHGNWLGDAVNVDDAWINTGSTSMGGVSIKGNFIATYSALIPGIKLSATCQGVDISGNTFNSFIDLCNADHYGVSIHGNFYYSEIANISSGSNDLWIVANKKDAGFAKTYLRVSTPEELQLGNAGASTIHAPVKGASEYWVEGVKVVDDQQGAIANDASGAANQATVNAILTALRNHGLIAT